MNDYFTAAVAGLTAAGAYAFAMLVDAGAPIIPAAVAGVALGALIGVAVGAVMTRWFSEASPATKAAVAALVLAFVFTLAITLFLSRSHVGLQLRARSERPAAAELVGIPVRALSLWVWGVSGAATALALILIAPQRSPNFLTLGLLIVPALAAALIGFFRNFWATLAGGVAIGVIEGLASVIPGLGEFRAALPFVVILAVLLWSQRGARWDEAR